MLLCASYFLGSVRRSGRKGKYYAICLLLFQWNFSLSLALSLSLLLEWFCGSNVGKACARREDAKGDASVKTSFNKSNS